MTLHAREWKRRSARMVKPGGCSLRRTEPRGPFKGCEETCLAFEACVELAREEKAHARAKGLTFQGVMSMAEGDIKTTFIFCSIYYCDSEFLLEVGHRFRVKKSNGRWGRKMDLTQLIGPIPFARAFLVRP